ncbi:MazF family transcriptional regulator [Pueribacillus theae]|uniref:MazF family transcriptional regulator n=1 Tax=Pueribacillus theae TaxID=2171751 RepID=A0A2U1K483_9BACI|nr:type II toxin-antitoxin system PemK/MazF family toxin [Pueribacillus theae]PWA11949.1 MazF family transcriptional regulator [Pueribacillus theae]
MTYKHGDILLIFVPFTDLSTSKQRPVLVVSNDLYNKYSDDLLVAAITSNLKNIDYSVIIQTQDLDNGELRKTSAIRADKLYTLSKHIVKRKFGNVKSKILNEVILKINEIF